MSNLAGKNIVITGGNSGIGYASAKELKARGANVVITGRNPEKIENAANELGVKGIVADTSNLAHIDNLVAEVKASFGHVDVLFINAGVFALNQVGELTEEVYDYQMNINFKGAVFTIEKFLPILKDGGNIINVSTTLSPGGLANAAIYSASKSALTSYSKTLALELAPRNIRVNIINPGPITTPIFQKTGMPEENLNGMASAIQNSIPLKRFGQPEEIAKTVAFLASDDASFITGSEYNVDGGIGINAFVH